MTQYTVGILGRVPLFENNLILLDVFVELGMANTSIDVKTQSAGKGIFAKDGSFYQRVGAAFLDGLNFTGTLANNVTSADFSGLPSWIKPGSVTVGGN